MIDALKNALERANVKYQVIPHTPSHTALGEAVALGLSPDEVAKTLVVMTPDGPIRVVLTAAERLDVRRLADALEIDRHTIRFMSEEELARDYPEFEVGAVPPLGGNRVDRVVADRAVAARESIVFDAGSHSESIRIAAEDFLRAAEAMTASIHKTDE
jgi:Ala-tRNA(Pro) deacylase